MKRNKYGLTKIEVILNWLLFWRYKYEPFYWFGKYYKEHDLSLLPEKRGNYVFWCRKLIFKNK